MFMPAFDELVVVLWRINVRKNTVILPVDRVNRVAIEQRSPTHIPVQLVQFRKQPPVEQNRVAPALANIWRSNIRLIGGVRLKQPVNQFCRYLRLVGQQENRPRGSFWQHP